MAEQDEGAHGVHVLRVVDAVLAHGLRLRRGRHRHQIPHRDPLELPAGPLQLRGLCVVCVRVGARVCLHRVARVVCVVSVGLGFACTCVCLWAL